MYWLNIGLNNENNIMANKSTQFTKENAKENQRKGAKAKSINAQRRKAVFETLKDYLLNGGSEKAMKELNSMTGKEFLDQFIKLLEYAKPKLARIDNTNNSNISINWSEEKTINPDNET